MEIQKTEKLETAAHFINSTGSHVFLTGKAGTGKTTFLRQLAEHTHKSYLIVAPTGIAALNAGGVTIHSQFLLPFGSFIPDSEARGQVSKNTPFFNRTTLTRVHTLNSMRKKVLRATELLIIDEVSMLRADILDAIDFRMRRAKGNYAQSFGGAQVLMIGDLHQLPPIVKEEEWQILQQYYPSMHFFEAQAFRDEKMIFIELDRIFRQQDDHFIRILNNLRDNRAQAEDIAILNSHYQPTPSQQHAKDEDEPIIVTTHNRTADSINADRMAALPSPSRYFDAEIDGDFPEKLFPLQETIELKEGARLMFVRNDSSEDKAYVNGSLATVRHIDEDEVWVEMKDSGEEYQLKRETWENKKYMLDEEQNEVVEEVVGSFSQYPVKPAWAVTVHKSQGLTFDRAVIDVGQAFAPGQVYVALSRLRSLEGLVLRTRINSSIIMSDSKVKTFTDSMDGQKPLPDLLQEKQRVYLEQALTGTFDFTALARQMENLQKFQGDKMEFEDEKMRSAMGLLKSHIDSELNNTHLFRKQLRGLLLTGKHDLLLERVRKGKEYYTAFMQENLRQILTHAAEVEQLTRTKTYRNALGEIEQLIMMSLGDMDRLELLVTTILAGKDFEKKKTGAETHIHLRNELWEQAQEKAYEDPRFTSSKSGRKRKKGAKLQKGESDRQTWELVIKGLSLQEISTQRKLALSTIEGHVVRGIAAGKIDVSEVLPEGQIEEITKLLKDAASVNSIHRLKGGRYSHGEIRMVKASLDRQP